MAAGLAGLGDVLELMMLQSAGRYDLSQKTERQRSNADLRALFIGLQPALRPEFVLELGAFRAEFSVAMARAGIPAHAFEANPYTYDECAPAIAETGLPVVYRNEAVSDRPGPVTFRIKRRMGGRELGPVLGSNSLLEVSRPGVDYEEVTVAGVTLDGYLDRAGLTGRPFSGWIDLEGALGQMFGGAGRAFDGCLSLMVEVEDRQKWKGQMIAPDVVEAFLGRGLVPVARDFEWRGQYNVVFLRRDLLRSGHVRLSLERHLGRPVMAPLA